MKKLTLPILAFVLMGMMACNSKTEKPADNPQDSIAATVSSTDSNEEPSGSISAAPTAQTPGQEAIQLMRSYLPVLENVKTVEELMQMVMKMKQDGKELQKKYGDDYKPTPEEEKEVEELTKQFQEIAEKKAAELQSILGN